MKKTTQINVIIILMILLQSCVAQKIYSPTSTSKVVDIEGKSKDELYIKANNWMVETFNNAKSVIQFSDKENGIIMGKYNMATIYTTTTDSHDVISIIKIEVKDGKAKITITPPTYKNDPNIIVGGKGYPLEQLNADVEKLISDFTIKMKEKNDDNW